MDVSRLHVSPLAKVVYLLRVYLSSTMERTGGMTDRPPCPLLIICLSINQTRWTGSFCKLISQNMVDVKLVLMAAVQDNAVALLVHE